MRKYQKSNSHTEYHAHRPHGAQCSQSHSVEPTLNRTHRTLIVGDEKRAKPNPRMIKLIIMNSLLCLRLRKAKHRKSVTPVKVIPIEATIRGSILSESLPAIGEKKPAQWLEY